MNFRELFINSLYICGIILVVSLCISMIESNINQVKIHKMQRGKLDEEVKKTKKDLFGE